MWLSFNECVFVPAAYMCPRVKTVMYILYSTAVERKRYQTGSYVFPQVQTRR